MRDRIRHALPAIAGLAVFLLALEVLRVELRAVSWQDISRDVWTTPPARLLFAVLLTMLNYAVLTGYDLLAFRYIGKAMPPTRVAGASFLAYAVSNNVGFAMLSGASVRYRFYSRWGVTAEELSRIVFSYSVTFWLGLLALGGVSALTSPVLGGLAASWRGAVPVLGAVLIAVVVAYLAATLLRREPLRLSRVVLPLPSFPIAIQQLVLSAADWVLAGAVLYMLLPGRPLPFLAFLGFFFLAILLGMVSHVPGGLGVFEGLMVLLLEPYVASGQVLSALVVYRAVYYLLPFIVALVVLVVDELRQRRTHVARAGAFLDRLAEALTPRVLAAFTFMAGVVLLVSGATPASEGRLAVLDRIFPLGVVEASHFLGSVTGAMLLVLSHGLARRLDAAYYLTTLLMGVGCAASLLKGIDYEEALLLAGVLVALQRSRDAFTRRAAFFASRFSPAWTASVIGALGASIWLGFFAFKHVGYRHELWWQFELHGEASRFLRATVGGAVVMAIAGAAHLLRPAPPEAVEPTDDQLAEAERVIAAQARTEPYLVLLGDKSMLFSEDRRAFVMYGVQGRTWLALGDPVGAPDAASDVIRAFLEQCDDYDGLPAFYQVAPDTLHRYVDFGLTFIKLGEQATVDLTTFTLQGGEGSKFRQAVRKLEREGATFRILPASDVPAVIPQLRAVSDDWLAEKAGAEKGFSLGFFDERYLLRFPVGLVERKGRILAFANLWPGPTGDELSLDLMRYHHDAPNGVMEALFVHAMVWGKEHGFRRFGLGMAPMSGFERSPTASFWNRMGAFLYEHGEAVYNFQGLRAYKDKFKPTWEPRYLAYRGGMSLPRILADAAALIAGGYRRILIR